MLLKRILTAAALAVLLALCAHCCAETFLITSDLHLTEDRAAHTAVLDALRRAAGSADAVILLGDSTNNAHPGEHALVLEFLLSLEKPAYVIPGNHDITADISAFIDLYAGHGWDRAFSRDADTASCAVLTEGGTCLLLMDTCSGPGYAAPMGGISDTACAWAAETLAALPAGTPVVACGHHPILPAERDARTPGAVGLAEALRGVKLYLCGHDHGFAAVKAGGLQQITVGQPHAFPGWAGMLEVTGEGLSWRVLPLYDAETHRAMREDAAALAEGMARGTLEGTIHEGDEDAIRWFVEAFVLAMTSRLDEEVCEEMLREPAAQKWREITTKTVVKKWILGLLENRPQDVRRIELH